MNDNSLSQKILIVAYDFPPQLGGVATYSLEIAESLQKQGHQVLVVTKKRPQLTNSFNFKVHPIRLPNQGLLSVPFLSLKLRKIISQFKPDQIINTLWMPDATASFLAQKSLGSTIPSQIIVHAMEILDSKETFKKRIRSSLGFLKHKVFKQSQRCICISEFTKNLVLEQRLCSPEKISVIHNGVNPNKYPLPEKKSSQSASPKLLTVARIVPHKGIDRVLEVLPQVLKTFPQLQYNIVGSGPDRNRLENIVMTLGLQNNVVFKGPIPNDQLNQLYFDADLFVLLSRQINHQVEGFGLVFLEAALCKTASLGGRSGGIPDAIIENETGWIVDPNDHSKITRTLLEILQAPEQLEKISQKAYEHTLKYRTWDIVTKKIILPRTNHE